MARPNRADARAAYRSALARQGIELPDDVDPLAAMLRGAGIELDDDELEGAYDALLADATEEMR